MTFWAPDWPMLPVSMPSRRTPSGDSVTWSTPLTFSTFAASCGGSESNSLDLAHPVVPMARSTAAIANLLLCCMTGLLDVGFDVRDWWSWRGGSLASVLALGDAEVQVERGDEEQVQQHRRDQAAEHHARRRVRHLVAGDVAADRERGQDERHGHGGHDDRREALADAARDQLQTGLRFAGPRPPQLLHPRDEDDRVADGDP